MEDCIKDEEGRKEASTKDDHSLFCLVETGSGWKRAALLTCLSTKKLLIDILFHD